MGSQEVQVALIDVRGWFWLDRDAALVFELSQILRADSGSWSRDICVSSLPCGGGGLPLHTGRVNRFISLRWVGLKRLKDDIAILLSLPL